MQPIPAAQPLRARPSAGPELAITEAQLIEIGQAAGRHGVRTMRDGSNIELSTEEEAATAIAIDPSLEGHELVTVTDPESGRQTVVALTSGEAEAMEPEQEVRQQRPRMPIEQEEEQEARFIKPVDRGDRMDRGERMDRGAAKPAPKMQGGTRVQLSDADLDELDAISQDRELGKRSLGRGYSNVRDPSDEERVIARSHRPFLIRESERRERIVVIDDEKKPPVIVSLAEKPSVWPNVLSAGMHAVGAMPLVGAVSHAPGGGIFQTIAGLGAIGVGIFHKSENSLQLVRTGVKHALWGIANTVLDAMGLYPVRLLATGVGAALDIANLVAARKPRAVQAIEVKEKPTFLQKLGAGLDYMAGGILKLFRR